MQTQRYTLIFGIYSSYSSFREYHPDLQDPMELLKGVVEVAKSLADEVEKETGAYVSFVATPALCGYKKEWGNPEGGEFVVCLSGERNPLYYDDAIAYSKAWETLAKKLKAHYKQTTARLFSEDVSLTYFKDSEVSK